MCCTQTSTNNNDENREEEKRSASQYSRVCFDNRYNNKKKTKATLLVSCFRSWCFVLIMCFFPSTHTHAHTHTLTHTSTRKLRAPGSSKTQLGKMASCKCRSSLPITECLAMQALRMSLLLLLASSTAEQKQFALQHQRATHSAKAFAIPTPPEVIVLI